MDTTEVRIALEGLITCSEDTEDFIPIGTRTTSNEECGLLTRNEGFVMRMEDGSEFQITVVQSR